MSFRTLLWVCLGACVSGHFGCAAAAPLPPPPTLTFGVDMEAEAAAVARAFEDSGYRLLQRDHGERYVALEFEKGSDDASAVRVVTVRGIALTLDGRQGNALAPAVRYRLVAPDALPQSRPVDGQGVETLYIREERPARSPDVARQSCVRLYSVSRHGVVTSVDQGDEEPGAPCLSAVDGDGDGRLELITEVTVDGLPLPVVPSLPVLYLPTERGELRRGGPRTALDAHYGPLVEGRQLALATAQSAHVAVEVYRLAVELAFAASLRGVGLEEQQASLRAAFAALPNDSRELTWEAAIMARAAEGW